MRRRIHAVLRVRGKPIEQLGPAQTPLAQHPTPFELWVQSGQNNAVYKQLLREHGHVVHNSLAEEYEQLIDDLDGRP